MKTLTMKVADLEAHPLSIELFGNLEEDRFLDLAADIERRGLQHHLETESTGRVVICGSQRLRAIRHLGWLEVQGDIHDELKTEDQIREHLILENVQRRQLTPAQMYRAGKELERIYAARAEENMRVNLRQGDKAAVPIPVKSGIGETTDQVGKKLGVSGDTFANLKTVYEKGSQEVQDQVDQGKLSITGAAKRIKAEQAPRRARKLDPDDTRAAALNWTRFDREVGKWEQFLKANSPGKYGQYEGEVWGRVEKLKAIIEAYLALKTGERAA